MKIAEKLKDTNAIANDFIGGYRKLINYLDPENRAAIKVLVNSRFHGIV